MAGLIQIQPSATSGTEGAAAPGGFVFPTVDALTKLRDTATRNGSAASNSYRQYLSNLAQAPGASESGIDFQAFDLPDPYAMAKEAVFNHASLKGDNPIDIDGAGTNGLVAFVRSQKAMDDYNKELQDFELEQSKPRPVDTKDPRIRPQPPEPEMRRVPGYDMGFPDGGVIPYLAMSESGHLDGSVPVGMRMGMGAFPSGSSLLDHAGDLMGDDVKALAKKPQSLWTDEDYGVFAAAQKLGILTLPDGMQFADQGPEKLKGGPLPFPSDKPQVYGGYGAAGVVPDPQAPAGPSAAARPRGMWAEGFFGSPVGNFGGMLEGLRSFASLRKATETTPDEDMDRAEADFKNALRMPAGNGIHAGLAGLRYLGAAAKRLGQRTGTNVSLTPEQAESMGTPQAPGPRQIQVGPLQAQEMRAALHAVREQGKVPWTQEYINSIPEENLIDIVTRQQYGIAAFEREDAVNSYAAWGEMIFSAVPGVAAETAIARSLAASRFVLTKAKYAPQAWRVAERVLWEGGLNAGFGAAFARDGDRFHQAWTQGALAGLIPIGGYTVRSLSTSTEAAGAFTVVASENAAAKFRESFLAGATRQGMDPALADNMADLLTDWHAQNLAVYGNDNLVKGALKPGGHIIDELSTDFVRKGAERAGLGISGDEFAAVKGVLVDGRKVAADARKALKDLTGALQQVERMGADAAILGNLWANPLQAAKSLYDAPFKKLRGMRLAGFQKYLDSLAKVPGMKERLDAVLTYRAKAGGDIDGLASILEKLEAIAPSNIPKLVRDAAKIQKELDAAAAILRDQVTAGRAQVAAEKAAIDREIEALFHGLEVDQRAFIENDPATQIALLEKVMAERMMREGSQEAAAAAQQLIVASKTIDAVRGRVAKLESLIKGGDARMAEAIAKQQRVALQRIAELERKYFAAVEDTGDAAVAARAASRKARLEKARDADIAKIRQEYADEFAVARERAASGEQARMDGIRAQLEEKPYSTWTAEDHAALRELNSGPRRDYMDTDVIGGGLQAREWEVLSDYEARIARDTDPALIRSQMQGETRAKFIDAQMAAHRKGAYDMSLHPNTRAAHKRALERFDKWKTLNDKANLHKRTLGRKGLSPESIKLHTEGLADVQRQMDNLAPKTPKDPLKAQAALDAESVMAELVEAQRLFDDIISRTTDNFGQKVTAARAEKLELAKVLEDAEATATKLEGILGKTNAKDLAARIKSIRDEYSGKIEGFRKRGGAGRKLPDGMDRETYDYFKGNYESLVEGKVALDIQQSAAERMAIASHQEATETVRAMVMDRVKTIKSAAETVSAAMKQATESSSERGYKAAKNLSGKIFDDDVLESRFSRPMDPDTPRGVPLRELPDKDARKALGIRLARAGRRLSTIAAGADHTMMLGGKRPNVLLRWAEDIGGLPSNSLHGIGDIPINVARHMEAVLDSGVDDAMKRYHARAVERATRDLAGFLARGGSIDEMPHIIDEIEKLHGLPPMTLDRAGIKGVAFERAKVISAYQLRGPNGRMDVLTQGDPATRDILASQYGPGFSKGRLKSIARDMGIDDFESTEVVIEAVKAAIKSSAIWDARDFGWARHAIRLFRMRGMSVAGRTLFNNFMVFDDGLGSIGVNVSPILAAIQRGAQREHELASTLKAPLYEAVESIVALQNMAAAADPRQVNELLTHYRMARAGAPNLKFTLEEVEARAGSLGIDLGGLQTASNKLDTFYLAGKYALQGEYEGIGVIEGTYMPVAKSRKAAETYRGRKRRKPGDPDMVKKREVGYTTGQEYDAMVLARTWYDSFVRGTAYRNVGEEVESALTTLRGILPDVQTGSLRNVQNPVITAFEEVVEYAQGRGKRYHVPGPIRELVMRPAANLQAAMLSAPRTGIMNAFDPFVILNSTDFSSRFVRNNRVALAAMLRSQPNVFKAGDYKRIHKILERNHATGQIDRVSSSSAYIMQALESGTGAASLEDMANNPVLDKLLTLNRYHDSRGRVGAYMIGESLVRSGIKEASAAFDPKTDFNGFFSAFKNHIGVGKYSDGEWNEIYNLADEALARGGGPEAMRALEEFAGVKMSNTLLFNYFPGAGSLITKNPWLRSVVPFYSYLGSRGALLLRSAARGNWSEALGAAVVEGAGLTAKMVDRIGGMPGGDIIYRSSGLVSYLETIRNSTGSNSPDDTALRNVLRTLGPGVANIWLPIVSLDRVIGNAALLSAGNLERAEKWLYYNGGMHPIGPGVPAQKDLKALQKAASDLPRDVYNLVMSIALLRVTYAAAESYFDARATDTGGEPLDYKQHYETVYPTFDRLWYGAWKGQKRAMNPEEKLAMAIENNAWESVFESFYGLIQGPYVEGKGAESFGHYTVIDSGPAALALDIIRKNAAEKLSGGQGPVAETIPPVIRQGLDEFPGAFEGHRLRKAANQ